MISAALFGAVAAAGVLPFAREAYEQTIRAGQVGVAASLAAFADAYAVIDRLNAGDDAPAQVESAVPTSAAVPIRPGAGLAGGTRSAREAYTALHRRMRESFAASTHAVLGEGIDAVVDFQDVRYGIEYLDRVEVISKLERDCDASPLTLAAGRYIAQAMVYDDVVRVADLKTRAGRFERIRNDVGAGDQQIVEVTEFMHPRVEEFCALLPVRLGQGLERSPTGIRLVSLILGKGKRVRTDSLRWFIVLYCVAGLRRFRRGTFRHQVEIRHLEQWLETVRTVAIEDLDLAVQVLRCRRLIKGYADTHVRGLSKFDRALAVLPKLQGRSDAAAQLAAVLEAALSDESGDAMDTLVASL